MIDPKRLLDDASGFERSLLESASGDAPSTEARAVAEAAAQQALASSSGASTSAALSGAKWVAATVLAGALAFGVWSSRGEPERPPTAPVHSRTSEADPPVVEPAPEAEIESDVVSAPAPSAPTPIVRREAQTPRAPVEPVVEPAIAAPPSEPRKAPPSLGEEIALLDRARVALERGELETVDRALRAHAERFESGRLRPEAMLLEVRLYLARKDAANAERVADRLRTEFPNSPLLPKLEQLLRSS